MKLIYSIQTDMVKHIVDPKTHRSGLKPTHEHPKLETEV